MSAPSNSMSPTGSAASTTLSSISADNKGKYSPLPTQITVTSITTRKPSFHSSTTSPSHHINTPPTSFRNPWPSSPGPHSLLSVLRARFLDNENKNFVPVPTDRSLLVPIHTPTWGIGPSNPTAHTGLKATWIGHASFLVEFPSLSPSQRGIRVLLDPVFSERMSPFTFLGPKRFTPPPCRIEDLPEVDVVCISHNHYDHLDAATVRFVQQRGKGRVRFFCGLGVGADLVGIGIPREEISEMDWWDGVEVCVSVDGEEKGMGEVGQIRVICTPSQHISGRWLNDHGKTLWCSFVLEEVIKDDTGNSDPTDNSVGTAAVSTTAVDPDAAQIPSSRTGRKLFFAGDTGYRAIPQHATPQQISSLPVCPAFREIGELYGPHDLALLPIGCYSPRWWMSPVHAAPEDSICIHRDVRSRKSIGMHFGVLRGGISQYYEEVTEPPRRWREACDEAGLQWGRDVGVLGVGETVVV